MRYVHIGQPNAVTKPIELAPLGLYVHIPWCERKCPYCDFNSHLAKDIVDEAAYVKQLLNDFDTDLQKFESALSGRELSSVFIGGGTPSLFKAESIATLLEGIKQRIAYSPTLEVTLEANPGSSEAEKFLGFRHAGVNRLSIGTQSFNAAHLKSLGRVHNHKQAVAAAHAARKAGFDNFNLDIMFGLPHQSMEQALKDVKTAMSLKPTHLSCYQLTIEPNTLFYAKPPSTPHDDALWEMQSLIQQELKTLQYEQYEVSAYALPQKRCQHNLNYWQFGDYFGIGAGAHGKITLSNGEIERLWKRKHPQSYIDADNKIGGRNKVVQEQIVFEFMLNSLRLNEGFNIELFEQRTGSSIDEIESILSKHEAANMLERNERTIRPTRFGHERLNLMLEDYLP